VEGPPGEGEAVGQEEPPVELREVEEEGLKETPQELEGCAWATPHAEGEQEEPPVELQEME
jgi:hypothetical protein